MKTLPHPTHKPRTLLLRRGALTALFIGLLAVLLPAPPAYCQDFQPTVTVDLGYCLRALRADTAQVSRAQAQEIADKAEQNKVLIQMLPQAKGSLTWMYLPQTIDFTAYARTLFPLNQISLGGQSVSLPGLPVEIPGLPTQLPAVDLSDVTDYLKGLVPENWGKYRLGNVLLGAVTVQQPLFAGGRLVNGYKLAGLKQEQSRLQTQAQTREAEFELAQNYVKAAALAQKIRLLQEFNAMLARSEADVAALKREGLAVSGDLLTIQIAHNEASLQQMQAQDGLRALKSLIQFQAKLPQDVAIVLQEETSAGSSLPVYLRAPQDLRDTSGRQELQSLDLARRANQLQRDIAVGSMLPELGFMANFHFLTPNVYGGLERNVGTGWMVGLSLQVPLTGIAQGYQDYAQAKANQALWELDHKKAAEGLAQQATQARERLQRAQGSNTQTQAIAGQADRNLQLAQTGYKEGVTELATLINAQSTWLKAHLAQCDALSEYHLAVIDCRIATGSAL